MKLSFFLFLVLFWISGPSLAKVYILNVHQPEEKTWRTLKTHFLRNYESENLIDTSRTKENVTKCTPELKRYSINLLAQRDSINYCLDKSYLALSAGLGHIEVDNKFNKGTHLNLSGESLYLSLSLLFSSSLSALNIFEFDMHLLPNFRNDDVEDLKSVHLSSYFNGQYIFQKRIENTSLSGRLGLSVSSIPTVKDESSSIILTDLETKEVNILTTGALLGFKYTFNHKSGGKQFLKLDYIPYVYKDGFTKDLDSYEFKLNYTYNFNRFTAMDFKLSYGEVKLYEDHSFQVKVMALGLKFYPF